MIVTLGPYTEALVAEATSAVDIGEVRLPAFHVRQQLRFVHESEMLSQMIFTVECPSLEAFV